MHLKGIEDQTSKQVEKKAPMMKWGIFKELLTSKRHLYLHTINFHLKGCEESLHHRNRLIFNILETVATGN